MTKGERKKLTTVAYHEAGHAVAAFLMRRRFKKVTIIPEGNALGSLAGCGWRSKLNPEYDDGARLRHRIEADIIVSLAGPVAEAKLTSRFNHIGACQDYHDAVGCALYVTDSKNETEAYINWLLERTKNILSFIRWDAVKELADELIKQREIGYTIARKIIRKGFDRRLTPFNLEEALANGSVKVYSEP